MYKASNKHEHTNNTILASAGKVSSWVLVNFAIPVIKYQAEAT